MQYKTKGNRLSPKRTIIRYEKIVRYYKKKGGTYAGIGRRFNVSSELVRSALMYAGLWTHYLKSREGKDKKIISLYLHGQNIKFLARRFGFGIVTVFKILKKAGVWKQGIWKKIEQERQRRDVKILALFMQGYSGIQVARKFNLSGAFVNEKVLVNRIKKERIKRDKMILRAYRSPRSIPSLSRRFKLPVAAVKRVLIYYYILPGRNPKRS